MECIILSVNDTYMDAQEVMHMTDYIKADIDFILSGDMGIQYHGVVVFFCGKYFRSTGRRIPMARASGSNDCNISFDWEKRFLGKAQVVCSDWIWPHVPVVYLCELWHERKFNLQSDRFANNHPFLYWSNCFGYRHSAWLCVFHGRKEYPKERVIYACQYINFNGLFIIQPIV